MYFRINYRFADETVSAIQRNDLQDQLSGAYADRRSRRATWTARFRRTSWKGPLAALKPMFSKLDANHDGFLDAKELSVVMQAMMMQQQSAATPGV